MSRGGARTGAGRPPLFDTPTERRSLILPIETWKALEALALVHDTSLAGAAWLAIELHAVEVGLRRKADIALTPTA
jgi:hypothetical protein